MDSARRMNGSPLSITSDVEEGLDLPRNFAGLLAQRCNEFLEKRNLNREFQSTSWFVKAKAERRAK